MTTRLPIRKSHKKNFGFTLIEMLVVVLIMGILLAVAIPLYLSSVKSAGSNATTANVKSLGSAAQAYRVKTGSYPTNLAALVAGKDIGDPNLTDTKVTYAVTGTATTCAVTATEKTGKDVFGSAADTDVISFQVDTGALVVPALP